MKTYGGQNMTGRLRRVVVRRPDGAFGEADPAEWHYAGRPDLPKAQAEHDFFVEILRENGAEIILHDQPLSGLADAIFTHDPALITDAGAVVLRMGKPRRRGEETAMAACLEAAGVPVLRTLDGDAQAEGGDVLWIDETTLAVGVGVRTNTEGLRQLNETLAPLGVDVLPIPLPAAAADPNACLHLLSAVSPVDRDLAVVFPPLLPAGLARRLADAGVRFVEVPDEEYSTLGTNVLALAPRRCVMLDGNPVTRRRLDAEGCEVVTFRGEDICLKAEGGPTCLTRPILRDDPAVLKRI